MRQDLNALPSSLFPLTLDPQHANNRGIEPRSENSRTFEPPAGGPSMGRQPARLENPKRRACGQPASRARRRPLLSSSGTNRCRPWTSSLDSPSARPGHPWSSRFWRNSPTVYPVKPPGGSWRIETRCCSSYCQDCSCYAKHTGRCWNCCSSYRRADWLETHLYDTGGRNTRSRKRWRLKPYVSPCDTCAIQD